MTFGDNVRLDSFIVVHGWFGIVTTKLSWLKNGQRLR